MAFSTRHAGGLGRSCGLGRTGVMVCGHNPNPMGRTHHPDRRVGADLEALQKGVANEEAWPNWTDTTSSGFEVLSSTPMDTLAARLETGAMSSFENLDADQLGFWVRGDGPRTLRAS